MIELRPIGRVRSPLAEPTRAPKQGFEGGPAAWLELLPALAPAVRDLRVSDLEAVDGTPIVDLKPVLDPRADG